MLSPVFATHSGNAETPRRPDLLALGEEAEFNRLDKDKSGQLDPKELTQSQLRVSHFSHVGK